MAAPPFRAPLATWKALDSPAPGGSFWPHLQDSRACRSKLRTGASSHFSPLDKHENRSSCPAEAGVQPQRS